LHGAFRLGRNSHRHDEAREFSTESGYVFKHSNRVCAVIENCKFDYPVVYFEVYDRRDRPRIAVFELDVGFIGGIVLRTVEG
jgi:hypothetical protein